MTKNVIKPKKNMDERGEFKLFSINSSMKISH